MGNLTNEQINEKLGEFLHFYERLRGQITQGDIKILWADLLSANTESVLNKK